MGGTNPKPAKGGYHLVDRQQMLGERGFCTLSYRRCVSLRCDTSLLLHGGWPSLGRWFKLRYFRSPPKPVLPHGRRYTFLFNSSTKNNTHIWRIVGHRSVIHGQTWPAS